MHHHVPMSYCVQAFVSPPSDLEVASVDVEQTVHCRCGVVVVALGKAGACVGGGPVAAGVWARGRGSDVAKWFPSLCDCVVAQRLKGIRVWCVSASTHVHICLYVCVHVSKCDYINVHV